MTKDDVINEYLNLLDIRSAQVASLLEYASRREKYIGEVESRFWKLRQAYDTLQEELNTLKEQSEK
jgi:hypothetical protein